MEGVGSTERKKLSQVKDGSWRMEQVDYRVNLYPEYRNESGLLGWLNELSAWMTWPLHKDRSPRFEVQVYEGDSCVTVPPRGSQPVRAQGLRSPGQCYSTSYHADVTCGRSFCPLGSWRRLITSPNLFGFEPST